MDRRCADPESGRGHPDLRVKQEPGTDRRLPRRLGAQPRDPNRSDRRRWPRLHDGALFYLRSRGINEAEARRLVVHGFFADIIRKIGVPELERQLLETLEAELAVNINNLGVAS